MGQQQSVPRNSTQTSRSYLSLRNQQSFNKRIEHEGLIKLRPVPFKNCIEIQTDQRTLFLQNLQITLKDLLQSRLYTNKLFPKQDIQRLIENVTYTLAFLQQNGLPYKDISPQNIFYDDGSFKLLPNELIPESRYKKFLSYRTRKCTSSLNEQTETTQNQLQFVTLSPQMIIAYRCKETQINDLQIIDKSNVFYLGMLFLEVTTLLPAFQCYDIQTCDILDQVITQRIQLVKEYYSDEIAAIIANFLDYDYVERMGLKEASIFVNRQLNRDLMMNSKISKELSNKKSKEKKFTPTHNNDEPLCSDPMIENHQSISNSQLNTQNKSISMSKSRFQNYDVDESRISRNPNQGTCQKKKLKTNKIYMNGSIQEPEQESNCFMKEQRNKVYMRQGLKQQDSKRQNMTQSQITPQRSTTPLKQIQNSNNINHNLSNIRPPVGKVINMSAKERILPQNSFYTPKSPVYQANYEQDEQNRYPQSNEYTQQHNMKRKNSTDYLGYRASSNINPIPKTPKQQQYTQNKYQQEVYEKKNPQNNYIYRENNQQEAGRIYPSKKNFEQRLNERDTLNEDSGSRGYFDHSKAVNSKPNSNTEFKDHDNSLSRIKSEIQRSRKLIEQFKRGQNTHY